MYADKQSGKVKTSAKKKKKKKFIWLKQKYN